MRLLAISFYCLCSLTPAFAGGEIATDLSAEDRATIEKTIFQAYQDPRVIAVIEKANEEQRNVSIENFELPPEAVTLPAIATSADKESFTHLGLILDAGLPDVFGASVVYRPWKWLRVHAGGTYNGFAPGIRAGVTVLPPVFFPILPTATIEAGHYFEGDANKISKMFSGESEDSPWLRRIDYDYVNGHLGIEVGSQNRFVFYIHGGVSYVRSTIHDFKGKFEESTSDGAGGLTTTGKDPTVSVITPSGKIGFLIYFL